MRVALDTSVLVAGSIAGHPDEPRATVWMDAIFAGSCAGVVTTHALAELCATLTAIPLEPRVPTAEIGRLVDRFAERLEVMELTWVDYAAAMTRCSERQRRSGAVYDALHLIAAERSSVDAFLTFNTRDFVGLSTPTGPRVVAPPDPPSVALP